MLLGTVLIALLSPQMGACAYQPQQRLIANLFPATPHYEATGKPWFRSGETLSVNGRSYVPEGDAGAYFNKYFYTIAEKDGIPIFVRELGNARPQRVYVMTHSRNCRFQPYVLREE